MKHRRFGIPILLCLALLSACAPAAETGADVPTAPSSQAPAFSYAAEAARYRPGDPGVRASGFVHADKSPVEDAEAALRRAQGECTVTYDAVEVRYDPAADMWMVSFFTQGMAGGGQCVYLDGSGVTRLIVYGE